MIFNILSGKKPVYTVTLYGYPNNTVLVDGTTTVNLNSSGEGTIVLELGSHTFKDGHVSSNTKTANINSDMTVVVGFYLGGLSQSSTSRIQGSGTRTASSSNTVTVPQATYTKAEVSGSCSVSQWQSATTNYFPEISVSGSITVAGVRCASGSDSKNYTESYWGTSRSASSDMSGTGTINFTGTSITFSDSVSASQGTGNAVMYMQGYVSVSEVYIY